MNAVFIGSREIDIPGSWNELSRPQLLAIVRAMRSGESEIRSRLSIFKSMTGIAWWRLKERASYALLDGAVEATEFIAEKNDLTRQLIPKFRGRYGPNDAISNLRMAEFSFAEFFYMQYSREKKDEDLNQLIACLYRRKRRFYNVRRNVDGDPRRKFNPNLVQRDAKRIGRWPLLYRIAILYYYEGCRNQKMAAFPKVFDGQGEGESLYGMWSVMRGVAKAGHFGDFDKVAEQYVDTILMELNETIAEAERMEAEMKKSTS